MQPRRVLFAALVGILIGIVYFLSQRVRLETVVEHRSAGGAIAGAASKAFAFLSRSQANDGSWPAFFSATSDFTQALPAPRIFTTAFVLRNLKGSPYQATRSYDIGERYVLAAKEKIALWAVDGRDHELFQTGRLHCKVAPDADTTSWALLLLAERLRLPPAELREVTGHFARVRDKRGLYGTYLVGYHGAAECPPDYGNRPSLGVNLSVLALFRHLNLDEEMPALEGALLHEVAQANYHTNSIYYRSRAVLAYLAALSQSVALTERIVHSLDGGAILGEIAGWDNVDLAAYLFAKATLCRSRVGTCLELEPIAEALVKRQNEDGSWRPAPLYIAGGLDEMPTSQEFFAGSPAETTALGLRALLEYAELLR